MAHLNLHDLHAQVTRRGRLALAAAFLACIPFLARATVAGLPTLPSPVLQPAPGPRAEGSLAFWALLREGDDLIKAGLLPQAVKVFGRARDLAMANAAEAPGSSDAQRDLMAAHDRLSQALGLLNDPVGALNSGQTAVTLAQALSARQGDSIDVLKDQLLVELHLIERCSQHGDPVALQAQLDQTRPLAERVAEMDPNDVRGPHAVMVTRLLAGLLKLRKMESGQGIDASMADDFAAVQQVATPRMTQGTDVAVWRRGLLLVALGQSQLLSAQGQHAQALGHAETALSLARQQASEAPTDLFWQTVLIQSAQQAAGARFVLNADLPTALKQARLAQNLADQLAAGRPAEEQWTRLALKTRKLVGLILRQQGGSTR